MKNVMLTIKNLSKKYSRHDNEITILDDINLDIYKGEIIGIVGRSGSGKSTLLRIIAGLIEPSKGNIATNSDISSSNANISMIFQNFGLIPWLTIFDNIAIGLDAQSVDKEVIAARVTRVMNIVGLTGYEYTYPKEMSGGMKQRVGFARALVMNPEILLMDEPFSALDYITANALKEDLLDLWFERNVSSLKSIIIVTHSVEEAVYLCDRVFVLSSNPGKIVADLHIKLPHPRDIDSQKFHDYMNEIYIAMTGNVEDSKYSNDSHKAYPQYVNAINLIHFLEVLKEQFNDTVADIEFLTEILKLTNDQICIFIDTLCMLKFIEILQNGVKLSPAGYILLDAKDSDRKVIFREHLVAHVNFIKEIYHELQNNADSAINRKSLLNKLQQKFSTEKATEILRATISWARFANLFLYDSKHDEIKLTKTQTLP